ncbi:Ig-like domain-containing protein [Paenibacillus sp. TRM 82003]|nr:Ig-like domain-containing protein [Paenibacillus sp. TRM 82003]
MSFRKWKFGVAMLLVFALLAGGALPASAADVVVSLAFEDEDPVHLYVDHDSAQLKALATLQGVAAPKDVTASAVWASTSQSIVKVDKGKLTPVGAGTAKVTAKYEGKTISTDVTVDYLYAAVKLNAESAVTIDLQDETIQLTATAEETDGTPFDVTDAATWTSSDALIATVDDGEVRLLKKGKATITAKYKGRSDAVTYTVNSPYQSIQLAYGDESYEFVVGQTGVELEAVAALVSGSFENVSDLAQWTSSNTSVVTVEGGKLTFKAQGVADITASRFGHSAKATVVSRLPYQALLLTPSTPARLFLSDEPLEVKAEVANDFESRTDVTALADWSTSDPLVVTVDDGVLKPRGVGAATVTVTYRGLTKTIGATVMPVVNGLHLDETEITLFKGEVAVLPDVYGKDLNGSEYSFADLAEWDSSNEEVVEIENGKLKAGAPGTATVTMRIRGETDTVAVTVREKALALIPSVWEVALVKGESTGRPTVLALLEDGTEFDVSNEIEWEVSSPNLLLSGSTMRGLLNSKVTLTGTYLNKKITIPVTIADKMTNVVVAPTAIELNPKRSKTVKVTGKNSTGKTVTLSKDVSWTSSNPAVATVNGSSVKAVAPGSATLTATFQGSALQVQVTVVPKLTKLILSEKTLATKKGESKTLAATAYYDDGTTRDVTELATWTSSNVNNAAVIDGKVTGVKKGSATVKAKFGNKSASVRVTVTD